MKSSRLIASLHLCRSFTELTRDHGLFSLSTPSAPNEIALFKRANGNMDLYIRNTLVSFTGLDYQVNTWHSICLTWDSVSGVAQVWIDGKQSSRKYVSSGSKISGPIIIVLGQVRHSTRMYTDNFRCTAVLSVCQYQFIIPVFASLTDHELQHFMTII